MPESVINLYQSMLNSSRTCGQSVVNAFIFIMYSQLAKDSLKVAKELLRFLRPSTFVCNASVSSRNSESAGSRNPSPWGALG